MATFQTRVEDYVGSISDTAACSEWLTDTAREIITVLPKEYLDFFSETKTDADGSTGATLDNCRILYVDKAGIEATPKPAAMKAKFIDATSIYLATVGSPIYYKEANKVYVLPGGGNVHVVEFPIIVSGDDYGSYTSTDNVSEEIEPLLVYGTGMKFMIKQMETLQSALPSMPTLTINDFVLIGHTLGNLSDVSDPLTKAAALIAGIDASDPLSKALSILAAIDESDALTKATAFITAADQSDPLGKALSLLNGIDITDPLQKAQFLIDAGSSIEGDSFNANMSVQTNISGDDFARAREILSTAKQELDRAMTVSRTTIEKANGELARASSIVSTTLEKARVELQRAGVIPQADLAIVERELRRAQTIVSVSAEEAKLELARIDGIAKSVQLDDGGALIKFKSLLENYSIHLGAFNMKHTKLQVQHAFLEKLYNEGLGKIIGPTKQS